MSQDAGSWSTYTRTMSESPSTTLLVIDVQNAVVDGAHDVEGVVARINSLIARARQDRVPVVFVQHGDEWMLPGEPGWQIVEDLDRDVNDPVVAKNYRDSFADTELEALLSELGTTRLIVTGAASDFCVNTTAHAALAKGFDVTLVRDAHTTGPLHLAGRDVDAEVIIDFVNEHFAYLTYPGRDVRAVNADHVEW